MARPGDLLLVFADALTRSWKQIIKFRPEGAPAATPVERPAAPASLATGEFEPRVEAVSTATLEGLIRDERGIRFAPEADD
jgi:cyanophycin synthetase